MVEFTIIFGNRNFSIKISEEVANNVKREILMALVEGKAYEMRLHDSGEILLFAPGALNMIGINIKPL